MRLYKNTLVPVVLLLALGTVVAEQPSALLPQSLTNHTIRGRVVWSGDALLRRHDVQVVPEAVERTLVLETPEGELYPLVEDVRGRAFRNDPRLRQMDVELLVRQHPGSPWAQIIRFFERTPQGRFEIDYWCEICSIALFELKECDCCQGPIEFRRRPVDPESGD